ncbi:MAG: AraC family transcriptional regulator [Pseudomonadota bacterium]
MASRERTRGSPAVDGDVTDRVPKVTGSSVKAVVDRAGELGLFEIDHASSGPNMALDHARFTVETHQAVIERSDLAALVLTMEGKGTLRAEYDGQAFDSDVRPGIFTWAPCGVDQLYDFEGRTTNVITTFSDALLDQIRDQNPELQDVRLDEPWAPFVQSRLSRLIAEQDRLIRTGQMGWRSLADAHMVQLAVELMCVAANRTTKAPRPLSPQELRAVEDHVRAHLDTNISLAEVAALSNRPVHGFCRAFKAASGESFHRFALNLRLQEAQRLLIRTEMPLAEIAFATGFSSQSHMTSTMKRSWGVTPGRLRAEAWRTA